MTYLQLETGGRFASPPIMFMPYTLIRAFHGATIALFLAASVEGFKQVFFPNVDPAKIALARSSR
jgi:hypothetical protein